MIGARVGDLLEQLANVAPLDVFDLHRTPPLDQRFVRSFARLLLVGRAVENADVLTAAAALLLRVALDVFVREIRERLAVPFRGLGRRRIASMRDIVKRVTRLLPRIGEPQRRVEAQREAT